MKKRHSLSGRLILLFLCASLLIALTVRTGFQYGIKDEVRNYASPHLHEYINHLRQQIGSPPDIQAAQSLANRLQLDIQISYAGKVWSSSGDNIDVTKLAFHKHHFADGDLVEVSHDLSRYLLRLQEADTTLLFMTRDRIGDGHLHLVIGATIVVVLLVIALTYHLVRRLFQPIQTIRQSVSRFGAGELDQRITLQRRDELGDLANSINTMADEIQAMLEAKRQLLLAISHELRSPLTRARLNAELLDESEPRARIIADIQLLEQQLAELLETERLESRHAKLDLQSTSPESLIESVIQQHFSTSRLTCQHVDDNQSIKLDGARIRLLIRNLLDNALKHTPESSQPVLISSQMFKKTWVVTVQDYGPGIPAEHLPHLTEPFYRVDKSRQRETGGYGLGLYLCRVITEAHRGTLQIQSEEGVGTCVTFTLPL